MNFGYLACPHQHTFQVTKSELWFGPNGFEVQSERDRDKGKLIERERETNSANKKQECKVYRYRLDIYNLIFAQHLDLQYIQGLLVIIFKDTHGAQQQQQQQQQVTLCAQGVLPPAAAAENFWSKGGIHPWRSRSAEGHFKKGIHSEGTR